MAKTFSGYLEKEEVRAVINALPSVSRHAARDILLFELLWQSGARVSEALTMTPKQIGTTSVILANLKQYKKVKVGDKMVRVRDPNATKDVEVSAELCSILKSYCIANGIKPDDYIFEGNRDSTGHLTSWYVWWIMDKASEAVGVFRLGKRNPKTGGRRKGAYPHLFRHSNAMKLLDETHDIEIVREQLGHADIKTTQIYAFTKKPRIKKEIAKIEWK